MLESTIRASRLARTALDIFLLAGLLGLFTQLNMLADSHHVNTLGKKYLADVSNTLKSRSLEPVSATHIQELHDTEATMWSSFFQWYGKAGYASGNCQFWSPNMLHPEKFYLQCTGENAQSDVKIQADPMQLFVADKNAKSKTKVLAQESGKPEKSAEKPATVKGWLDTPSGRKYFDPVAKRWTP